MDANLPDKLTRTMDGQEYLHIQTWSDEGESVLSDSGAEYPGWRMGHFVRH